MPVASVECIGGPHGDSFRAPTRSGEGFFERKKVRRSRYSFVKIPYLSSLEEKDKGSDDLCHLAEAERELINRESPL